MKIFYYQREYKIQNFGDDLNDWFWRKLLPGFINENDENLLVGFGTLLNNKLKDRLPNSKNVFFLSAGAGYEHPLDNLAKNWKFYSIRGPLTARALRLDDELAIVDAAVLVRLFFSQDRTKHYRYSFMPHVNNAICNGEIWERLCHEISFNYIDPRRSTEDVLAKVAKTEILITEAMHGAIVADTLRVPWVPVSTSPKILSFKWQDWCQSLNLEYVPKYIPTV